MPESAAPVLETGGIDVPIVIHFPGCNTNSSTCTCGKIAGWPARPS